MPVEDMKVVGIGASAGGLEAIQLLFDDMPDDTGMAFVIVQHLSPDFKSLMSELLAKHTNMPIYTAEDGMALRPNCIYLNQRNKNLSIKNLKLVLADKSPKDHLNLPVDIFFTALAKDVGSRAIGIILSGTGSDGSRGIKHISEEGGAILVQEPASAQFDGMPNSAINTHLADYIVQPENMPEILERFSVEYGLDGNFGGQNHSEFEKTLQGVLKEIQRASGINFLDYKRATILRRLEKRLAINNHRNLKDYLKLVQANAKERDSLKQDFLIGVTSFFRDPQAFEVLKTKVIPEICHGKPKNSVVRVWVAGCSTGEEVYSVAMLLDEYIRLNELAIDYKIFATDVDNEALITAGAGIYPVNITTEVDRNYLENYFVKVGDQVQIIKRLREHVVFSQHNLINDPPFIRLDLVCCRNLLIYLENAAQQRVLSKFQFALNENAHMFLGTSESLGDMAKSFKTIDQKAKVFRNAAASKSYPYISENSDNQPRSHYNYGTGAVRSTVRPAYKRAPEVEFLKALLKRYAPSGIVTDSSFDILYVLGDVARYLSIGEGVFGGNLMELISVDMASVIRTGIRKAKTTEKEVRIQISGTSEDGKLKINELIFTVLPSTDDHQEWYFCGFTEQSDEIADVVSLASQPITDITKQRIEDLESELTTNQQELQNVVEELETSNEELQSSNEELMASNEELQSTNEELQSVNEELYTVNAELQDKNRELTTLNNDITNLLNSTDIGTLFLDAKLNIRKFTPALKSHFNLREEDIGRSIKTFAPGFGADNRKVLITDAERVLRDLVTVEHEMISDDDRRHLVRITPFVTTDKKIDGLVITFIDIERLRRSQDELSYLAQINKFADEDETFEQFLKKGAIDLAHLLGLSFCSIYLLENQGTTIRLAATSRTDRETKKYGDLRQVFTPGYSLAVSTSSVLSKVIENKTAVRSADPEKSMQAIVVSPKLLKQVPHFIETSGYSGAMRVPLVHQQTVVGVLEISLPDHFSHDDHSALERISRQIAATISKRDSDDKAREYQNSFKTVVQATPTPILITRLSDGATLYANESFAELLKLPVSAFDSQPHIAWVADEKDQETINRQLSKQGFVNDLEVRGRKADGTEFWALFVARTMEYLGEPCVFHGIQDITTRHEQQSRLKELVEERTMALNDALEDSEDARNKVNAIISSIAEGLLVVSNTGDLQLMNPVSERLLNLKPASHQNKSFEELDIPDTLKQAIKQSMTTDEGIVTAVHKLRNLISGSSVEVLSTTTPVIGQNDEIRGYVTVLRDITHERAMDRMKTDFIANAAHQFRTPLTSIQGYSEILETRGDIPEDQRKQYMNSIGEQSKLLSEIIDELLDVAKIESGEHATLDYTPTYIQPFIEGLTKNLFTLLKDHELVLDFDVDDQEHPIDRVKLGHTLRNLLSNAAKYSEDGSKISLSAKLSAGNLVLQVQDQGKGMTDKQIDNAFDRFWRADNSTTAIEGSGLGLAIAKSYVDVMRGSIWIESQPGAGTTVTVVIPVE